MPHLFRFGKIQSIIIAIFFYLSFILIKKTLHKLSPTYYQMF